MKSLPIVREMQSRSMPPKAGTKLTRYTYVIPSLRQEFFADATSEREAHQMVWQGLTDEQRDLADILDWIDTEIL